MEVRLKCKKQKHKCKIAACLEIRSPSRNRDMVLASGPQTSPARRQPMNIQINTNDRYFMVDEEAERRLASLKSLYAVNSLRWSAKIWWIRYLYLLMLPACKYLLAHTYTRSTQINRIGSNWAKCLDGRVNPLDLIRLRPRWMPEAGALLGQVQQHLRHKPSRFLFLDIKSKSKLFNSLRGPSLGGT